VIVPGERMCVVRFADACTGRNSAPKILRQFRDHGIDHALADDGVGGDREMRPVLLRSRPIGRTASFSPDRRCEIFGG